VLPEVRGRLIDMLMRTRKVADVLAMVRNG
jgi:hypothetical protein